MTGPIGRVVVRLDAAAENHTAIDTAVRLAARSKAPLHAVFIEDEDLLHLAALPFAREATVGAAGAKLTTAQIERQLRAAAERARREIAAAAERHEVAWSFKIVRGGHASVAATASSGELLVAGARTRPVAGAFRVEARWWSSLEISAGALLLARRGWDERGSVVIVIGDRSPASARLIEAAANVAETRGGVLTAICDPILAGSVGFEQWIGDHLAPHSLDLQIELAAAEPEMLERLHQLDCALLAIAAGAVEGRTDRLRQWLDRLACDLLIVG